MYVIHGYSKTFGGLLAGNAMPLNQAIRSVAWVQNTFIFTNLIDIEQLYIDISMCCRQYPEHGGPEIDIRW